MKKIASTIVILFGMLFAFLIWFKYLEATAEATVDYDIYPTSTIVTEVNNGIITVTDFEGRMWQFYDDTEDWFEGDICAIIMSNNGTNNTVYDDIVLETRYCGWVN